MCFGRRNRGGGGGGSNDAAAAAAEARARADAEAARVRAEHEKQMAVMDAKIASVKKASAYNPNMKVAASQGDISKGLSRKASNLKKKRAMRTRDTRIRLDPQAGTAGSPVGSGQVNV